MRRLAPGYAAGGVMMPMTSSSTTRRAAAGDIHGNDTAAVELAANGMKIGKEEGLESLLM